MVKEENLSFDLYSYTVAYNTSIIKTQLDKEEIYGFW